MTDPFTSFPIPTILFEGGNGGGVPGGSNGQIQFNNDGSFGGYSNTQLTALLDIFTATLKGAVPASGGGTTNFLRADGTWAPAALPGAGTDPLYLVEGMNITVNNIAIPNPGDIAASYLTYNSTSANSTPTYGNQTVHSALMNANHGDAFYNAQAQLKTTWIAYTAYMNAVASGQRILYNNKLFSYGMSDSAIEGHTVQFAGGPIVGDEGQCFQVFSTLKQQHFLSVTTIASIPTPSGINTTTTQYITRAAAAQAVTVVSTAGAVVGDWVVIQQELPTDGPSMEAVLIEALTATSITAKFRNDHASGVTVTPALRLVLANTFTIGQDRVLINKSGASYTIGTVDSIVGGGFNGLGTAWTVDMVGGNALNIGAISLDSDEYTSTPFNGAAGPLRSWYQIRSLPSGTSLQPMTTTVAGDLSYRGKGVGTIKTYRIVPCAKILRVLGGNELICETSTHTWTVGDNVEQPICPYPDVSGYQWNTQIWTNGAMMRSFFHILNTGARKWGAVLEIPGRDGVTQPGGDGVEWGALMISDARCDVGLHFSLARFSQAAILLSSADTGAGYTDVGGSITWGSRKLQPNSANQGLDIYAAASGGPSSVLAFSGPSMPRNPDTFFPVMDWGGYIRLPYGGGAARPFMEWHRDSSLTDFTRVRAGYNNDAAPTVAWVLETQLGGAGQISDIVLKTNGVEQIRCVSGGGLKLGAAASFSANGIVATTLGSLGPAGAAATVQKWLTIVDNTGTTRYIPCW